MKSTIVIAGLFVISLNCIAAESIKEVQKETLSCNESVTGADVKLKIETIYSSIEFKGGSSSGGVTKRIIEITVNGQTAKSVIEAAPIPLTISWNEANESVFLNDNYKGSDGVEYRNQSTLFDAEKKQYPAELIRLRALVPNSSRITHGGQTVSGYSTNIVLPESRLQDKTFFASGYVDYMLAENKDNADFTIGLAGLECSRTREDLNATKACLTKKDEARMAAINKEFEKAKVEKSGCENMWGAAACLSPRTEAELRYLKSLAKCQ